ncbi:hypothetical protein ACFZDK_39060 [Streptomyces sp. NPDC007901]|uniref:hypothetical protein n=1 Tax=Streptomyces sp. NPDC007901 TaxID=3364785 RepID=UPI0036EAF42F
MADLLGAAVLPAARRATPVTEVVITEPGDRPTATPGALILAVGARPTDLVGRTPGAAVAVREDPALLEAAEKAGTTLLVVPPGIRWDEVAAVVQGELARAAAAADDRAHGSTPSPRPSPPSPAAPSASRTPPTASWAAPAPSRISPCCGRRACTAGSGRARTSSWRARARN